MPFPASAAKHGGATERIAPDHRVVEHISRPAVSDQRLSLTAGGNIRYRLKTPYRDGTTYVIFEPLDFIARLAAPVRPEGWTPR